MIQEYEKKQFIDKLSSDCSLFKAIKNNKLYFMYEYSTMNMCDEYNFKILKKLITCSHVLGVIEKFECGNCTYFITEFIESNILKEQLKKPHQIFQLSQALSIFANLVQINEELHQKNVIYRNFRLETIGFQNNQLFLSDFTFSQIVKRRERYFQIVGVPNYMAPQYYLEDGYGYEVDIWAIGVCLFYMVTGSYPFSLEGKNEDEILKQIMSKCKKGFNFLENASVSKKAKYIQSTKYLEELFEKIFNPDYTKRISIQQLKAYPILKKHFKGDPKLVMESEIMSVIQEQTYTQGSIFMSMLSCFQSHHEFHKEEIILDFMEHSSEILMLDSHELISQQLKARVNFSILKVGLLKTNNLMNVLYGIKQSEFMIDPQEWEQMKKTTGFVRVKQKVERKKKIFEMLFRAAFLNVQQFKNESPYYSELIPEEFLVLKQQFLFQFSEYRQNLSKMFEIEKEIMKKKEKKEKVRKTCQNLVRLTILCMINRLFQDQNLKENFKLYYEWSKKQSLEDLEEWIENQKIFNLKLFIKQITSKYMQ